MSNHRYNEKIADISGGIADIFEGIPIGVCKIIKKKLEEYLPAYELLSIWRPLSSSVVCNRLNTSARQNAMNQVHRPWKKAELN